MDLALFLSKIYYFFLLPSQNAILKNILIINQFQLNHDLILLHHACDIAFKDCKDVHRKNLSWKNYILPNERAFFKIVNVSFDILDHVTRNTTLSLRL